MLELKIISILFGEKKKKKYIKKKKKRVMLEITKVKPLFTSIVTTADRFEKDIIDGGLIMAKKGDLKLWQRVVAIGSSVRDIEVGDMVMINADHYALKRYDKNSLQNDLDNNPTIKYAFNFITIYDGNTPKEYLLLNDRDILYAFEGKETEGASSIILPSNKVIV